MTEIRMWFEVDDAPAECETTVPHDGAFGAECRTKASALSTLRTLTGAELDVVEAVLHGQPFRAARLLAIWQSHLGELHALGHYG